LRILTQKCKWSVTGSPTGENFYVWDVIDGWMGEDDDAVTVKCDPLVPWGKVVSHSESDDVVLGSMH
jgi:hypothetical protein